jgi:glycosyl transferase family 1
VRIAFLGNFSVPYSTESHHKWTWERLGHTVIPVQENKCIAAQFFEACRGADLVQVTHTHGWGPQDGSMERAMIEVKAMGVPTMSYHLDYYWGLSTWDKRADRVGKTWDWKVDYFFSTDGAHDAWFRELGVNHHWLPPGVVESGCYEGQRQQTYACDVAFAGSVSYHPEYPFRPRLVQALRDRYGARFRLFQGVREKALNDVYASAKVVVGDHIFAGTPCYWSDRCPETCGRGGFIVYPETEGMTIPVVTYEPQDLEDLFAKIDYYLENENEREVLRRRCHEHVRVNDTYTNRLQEILKVMGLA